MIKKILIICFGNTARSPAGEYLTRYYVKKYNLDLSVQSAGFINAFADMQPLSKNYLRNKGIDPSGFSPKTINHTLLEEHELIITMKKTHKRDILQEYDDVPDLQEKMFTLKEFVGDSQDLDIIDPYYESNSKFQEILEIIDDYIEKMVKKIRNLNENLEHKP